MKYKCAKDDNHYEIKIQEFFRRMIFGTILVVLLL